MRQLIAYLLVLFCLSITEPASALLSMELTKGVASAVPIVISPFKIEGVTPQEDIVNVVSNDLKNSGRFKVYNGSQYPDPKKVGANNIVSGTIKQVGFNQYQVKFELRDFYHDSAQGRTTVSKSFVVPSERLRSLAHHVSDMVYQHVLGVKGVFSTKLVYVLVKRMPHRKTQYALEVSDQDGYNPRSLLTSKEPIMSPAWSPDGKKIAYVSFENRQPSIFVQDTASGVRQKITSFKGINGAPAWSPDGRKLAVVLSKDGSPNIYVIDLSSRQLTKLTQDWSINTEPAWSKDGKSLIFTSNRSGGPQIYQKTLPDGSLNRITFAGNYNARASFTPDGTHIVLLNREANLFNIGLLDLDSGVLKVLTTSSGTDNESPSVAPNGSMVLYGTLHGGRSILAMAATDGSVQIRLPARDGEVQDPAWSPFLS